MWGNGAHAKGWVARGGYNSGGLVWGYGSYRQFNADIRMNWLCMHVHASNKFPSEVFSYLYSTFFLTVLDKIVTYLLCVGCLRFVFYLLFFETPDYIKKDFISSNRPLYVCCIFLQNQCQILTIMKEIPTISSGIEHSMYNVPLSINV